MKILALSDTHVGAGYEHRRDALADTAAMFDQVADLAEEQGVDLIVHAGDVFHRAKPSPAELHVFKRFCDRLSEAAIPMVAIEGNGMHSAAPGQRSALELFASRWVEVSRSPEIVPIGGVTVCTLPPASAARLRENGDDSIDLLLRRARDLFAVADSSKPRILLAHQMVSGASLPTGLPVEQIGSTVLPLWALEEMGWDAVILGDLHKAQVLSEDPATFIAYCGSPQINDFGEKSNTPGVWIYEADVEVQRYEFVPLSVRRFVTVDVDLTNYQVESDAAELRMDETDTIVAAIAVRMPLTDAVVRVRYRATEDQHRRVDHQALTRLLDEAGVHRVYGGIAWEPVRESRARVAELDESLEPLAAVDLWSSTQSLTVSQADGLRDLIGSWIGEA